MHTEKNGKLKMFQYKPVSSKSQVSNTSRGFMTLVLVEARRLVLEVLWYYDFAMRQLTIEQTDLDFL